MQPYFFPYLAYYQAISAVNKYILYDNLTYIKERYMHRNRYLVVNGKPTFFTVSIKHKSSNTLINQIELSIKPAWRTRIRQSIYLNYKHAPYFNDFFPVIDNVLNTDTNLLTNLNARSIIDVSRYLEISTDIVTDVADYQVLEEKLANREEHLVNLFPYIKLKPMERKVIRVIEICRRENADIFINAIGGQTLYSKDDFAFHNIALFFIKSDDTTYTQRSPIFYPNLSIIDVVMNCGKEKTMELLRKYTLI